MESDIVGAYKLDFRSIDRGGFILSGLAQLIRILYGQRHEIWAPIYTTEPVIIG